MERSAADASKTPSRVEHASEMLRQGIRNGSLQPGQRLSEVRLAKEFGLSRGPIREALRGLERDGIVTTVPNRATFVVRLTRVPLLEAIELRSILEPEAWEQAVARRRDALTARLVRVLADMRTRLDDGDMAGLAELHSRFHGVFYREARNRLYKRIWEQQIEAMMDLHVASQLTSAEAGRQLVADHEAFVTALSVADPETGRAAIVEHLRESAKAVKGLA